MKLPTSQSKIFKYFHSYLIHWMKKKDINQAALAERFEIHKGQLNEIINEKTGISIYTMEKICSKIGINVLDALEIGRQLLGEKKDDEKLTEYQKEAMEAFKKMLLYGGEIANELAERAIINAQRKQFIEDSLKETPKKKLKSA